MKISKKFLTCALGGPCAKQARNLKMGIKIASEGWRPTSGGPSLHETGGKSGGWSQMGEQGMLDLSNQ